MAEEPVGADLVDLIDRLRLDLAALNGKVEDEKIRFAVDSVEVELRVAVKKEGGVNAKARFWVLELGADGKYAQETGHTIKVKLTPRASETTGNPKGELLVGR